MEGVVGLFALLGFLYVPLGRHTGYEHARAVLTTPAASAALADLGRAVAHLRQSAVAFLTANHANAPGRAPNGSPPETHTAEPPRPVPPKLK